VGQRQAEFFFHRHENIFEIVQIATVEVAGLNGRTRCGDCFAKLVYRGWLHTFLPYEKVKPRRMERGFGGSNSGHGIVSEAETISPLRQFTGRFEPSAE
jgi:hypothetical protein